MKRPIVGKSKEPGNKNRKEGFTMKTLRTLMAFAFVATLLTLVSATSASAVDMGTPVTNQAVVNYDVATVAQTPIESSPTGNSTPGAGVDTQFFVDNIVIVTVTNTGNANVTIGSATEEVLTFRIDNGGNADQRYILSAINGTNGADDIFDMSNVKVYVDAAGFTAGAYDPGDDTEWALASDGEGDGTGAGVVAAGGSMFAYIVADTTATNPGSPADGTTAIYWLNAQTADDAQTTALVEDTDGDDQTDPYVEEARFADVAGAIDAAEDGEHSAVGTYTVASAALTVQKTVTTIWDPYDLAVFPIAIPGALVQYEIVVTNNSATPAELTTIVDVLNANVQIDSDHNTSPGNPASGFAGNSVHIVITGSSRAAGTNFYATADNGDFDVDGAGHSDPTSVGGTLTLNMGTLMPVDVPNGYNTAGDLLNGETVTITFVAIVQ